MNSNAPGQLLGYVLEVPRALFHLLKAGPGDIVCVEVFGDVATLTADFHLVAEEDKSSINSNPLTNKSTDLWKTFYNWITAINNGDININKAIFILFSNQSGKHGIVNTFHSAKTKEEAQNAISEAKRQLVDVNQDHDIWKYYNYVANQNENQLAKIIQNFELQIGCGAGYEEVEKELVRQHLLVSQVPHMLCNIVGWLQKELTERIFAKKPAMIKWEDFDKQFKVLFHRIRCLELIDFTLKEPIKKEDIQQQVKVKPCYLKQLDAVGSDSEDIVEAVSAFLRAKVNRDKWIEDEIFDESIAIEFHEKLISFWSNQKKRINLTRKDLSEEDRGQILLLDCKNRQERIRDMSPPSPTIAGTYHALADEPVIGWHPNWKNLFK